MLAGAVLAAAVLAIVNEPAWERIAEEDGVVEWATVVAWGLCAALLLSGLRSAWRASRLLWLGLLCIGAFCVFVAGEEISWGQRLLAFRPPDMFLERNFQQELNVHNLLIDERNLGFKLESRHLVAAIALLYGVAGPLLARVRALSPAAQAFPPLQLWPAFLAVAVIELWYPVELAGEGAELLLGLCFLAGRLTRMPWRRAAQLLSLPLLLGALMAPLFARAVYGDDAEGTATAQQELELMAQDIVQQGTDELARKGTVHKRLFTAVHVGYLDFDGGVFLEGKSSPAVEEPEGEVRRDRRGYFLDPWNNPYWIVWSRNDRRVLLYSFGANRLRDTDTVKQDVARGDDVLLRVTWDGATAPSSP